MTVLGSWLIWSAGDTGAGGTTGGTGGSTRNVDGTHVIFLSMGYIGVYLQHHMYTRESTWAQLAPHITIIPVKVSTVTLLLSPSPAPLIAKTVISYTVPGKRLVSVV